MADDKHYNEKLEAVSSNSDQYLEDAGRRLSTTQEIEDLSNIEATAASKAAWLISITVSLGGFLFGYDTVSTIPLHCARPHRPLTLMSTI